MWQTCLIPTDVCCFLYAVGVHFIAEETPIDRFEGENMWSLTITNPRSEPVQIKIVPGRMLIGRMKTCDIVIDDAAASRRHAEIYYDPLPELVTIKDLKSSNGTYVNRQGITGLMRLQNGDIIRIGQAEMHLARLPDAVADQKDITGTRLFKRDLVLGTVDEHPIVLNDIMEKLNTVIDIDSAITLLTDMIKRAMGVDICEITLAQNFSKMDMRQKDNLAVRAIRNLSVEASPLVLCVPVISAGEPLALIYLEKIRPDVHHFNQRDVQLAVGISHHIALAMQRIKLLEEIRKEGHVRQLLLRFVSPIEANGILVDYLNTGNLPALSEKKVSLLYVEFTDPRGPVDRSNPIFFVSLLDPFYQFVTKAVLWNEGMVKYLGDGVLAVFIETEEGPGPEDRAVSVGQDIMGYIKNPTPFGTDQVGMAGVTINTGRAWVGYVGSRERAEFNVLGDLFKVTYQMQEQALPNRILVGESTATAVRNKYVVHEFGSMKVRQCEGPIQIYEVLPVKTTPFVKNDKDSTMTAALKAVAEKLRARGK